MVHMRFPGGLPKALTLSYDDNVEQDIRLVALLHGSGLKATFNLNSGAYSPEGTVFPAGQVHRRMTRAQIDALYLPSGMEVAVHGLHHPFWNEMDPACALHDILTDRMNLEAQFGCIVRGAAYPYGAYNDSVVASLRQAGIVYCRTVESTHDFRLPQDWLRLKPTCHHDDPALMALLDKFLHRRVTDVPQLFYLWGHSYEFEAHDNWRVIEDFTAAAAHAPDVWYATNIELHDYIEAFRSLRFSVCGTQLFNPTAYTLFYADGGEVRSIAPGETQRR